MKHVSSTSFCVRGRDQGRSKQVLEISIISSLSWCRCRNYQDQQSTMCFELAIFYFVVPALRTGACGGLLASNTHTGWDQACPLLEGGGKHFQNKKQEDIQKEAVVCPCHQAGRRPWGPSLCLVADSRLASLDYSSFLGYLLHEELACLDFPSHQEIVLIACSSCFPR